MAGAVEGSSVPGVAIEDHHCPGRRDQHLLAGVGIGGVLHLIAGGLAAIVGARDNSSGSIVERKIIQQPDRVADKERTGLRGPAPVRVEVLEPLAREGGAVVERRELQIALQDMGDPCQDTWVSVARQKEQALVHEVGEAVGSGLLVHLDTRTLPFFVEELREPPIDRSYLCRCQDVREGEKPFLVELEFFRSAEGVVVDSQGGQCIVNGHAGEFVVGREVSSWKMPGKIPGIKKGILVQCVVYYGES